jgi:hypothetical protein
LGGGRRGKYVYRLRKMAQEEIRKETKRCGVHENLSVASANFASGLRSLGCVKIGVRWREPKKPAAFAASWNLKGCRRCSQAGHSRRKSGLGEPHVSQAGEPMNIDLKRWALRKEWPEAGAKSRGGG